MKTSKHIFAIVALTLALLLVSSPFIGFSSSTAPTVTAPTVDASGVPASVSQATDYGDIMQYDWPLAGYDEGQSGCNPGPGPDKPDILWQRSGTASGFVTAFDGKVFAISGGRLNALDPFNGSLIWRSSVPGGGFGGSANRIDDTYLFVDTSSGVACYRIDNGTRVSTFVLPGYSGHPGSAQYFPGTYSSTLKMKYVLSWNDTTLEGLANGINLTDPTNPKLAWTTVCDEVSEIIACGGGNVYIGSTQSAVYALDGKTGDFVWRSHKTGVAQQHGMYYDGKVYHAASSQFMSCFDGETGKVLWEYDSNNLGTRGFFAYRGAAGYGRVYDCCISVEPSGWICCWDAETGELLWKQPAYYMISYNTVALAGGKVYVQTCDSSAGSETAGLVMPGYSFTCFDAFTGTKLWQLPMSFSSYPTVAYGTIYGTANNRLTCIGAPESSEPWSLGYAGNIDRPRVAVGQSGPEELNVKWMYKTDAAIHGSPAIVDGRVYIGSDDYKWYCLDAHTGSKIWDFTTEWRIGSSAAVVDGKVYTGADDGNIYCLDADTGAQLWKTPAGGLFKYIMMPQELQSRSSPIIVDDKLYVGALDGNVYCLDTATGNILWTRPTEGPIGGSPAYANGIIYIASTDTYLYALDATTGGVIWKSVPLNLGVGYGQFANQYFCTGTPVVVGDKLYIGGGVTYGSPGGAFGGGMRLAAFNAINGTLIWKTTIAGNTACIWIPTYFNGKIYAADGMYISCIDATTPNSGKAPVYGFAGSYAGNRTWAQWLGWQILSSAAYADDLRGDKVYIGCDVGSVTCVDATNGEALSAYQTDANVESSPAIWEGKLYIGSDDGYVYCFDDSPVVSTSIWAESSKGAKCWSNETVVISGQLVSYPDEMVWEMETDTYVPVASDLHPGIPNAEILVTFTDPDGTLVNETTTTDGRGYFSVSYTPNVVGNWSWMAWYEGADMVSHSYTYAYGDWNSLEVVSETTPKEAEAGIPMEYVYAAVAVIAIVIIVIVGYLYMKRGKK